MTAQHLDGAGAPPPCNRTRGNGSGPHKITHHILYELDATACAQRGYAPVNRKLFAWLDDVLCTVLLVRAPRGDW